MSRPSRNVLKQIFNAVLSILVRHFCLKASLEMNELESCAYKKSNGMPKHETQLCAGSSMRKSGLGQSAFEIRCIQKPAVLHCSEGLAYFFTYYSVISNGFMSDRYGPKFSCECLPVNAYRLAPSYVSCYPVPSPFHLTLGRVCAVAGQMHSHEMRPVR